MRIHPTLRSTVVSLLYLTLGQVALVEHAMGQESVERSGSQAPSLFHTYLLLSTIANDQNLKRNAGYVPHLERIGLAPEAKERLVTLSVDAHNKDVAYQRKRLTAMCALGSSIRDKEQLANEYVDYSEDIQNNQEELAQSTLAKLPPQERDSLISWQDLWFTPNTKQISGSEREAILGSSYSAQGLLQKFCDTLKTDN